MLRIIAYLSITVILLIMASCSQQQKDTNNTVLTDVDLKSRRSNVSNINQKKIATLTHSKAKFDTSLLYRAKIRKNIGTFVEHSMDEIDMLTSNVPRKQSLFSIAQINGIQTIEKQPTLLKIVFDNDIFDNTDYYYTNGINIELITPLAIISPLSGFLIGLSGSQINLYGFSIKQNIYTPINPDIAEISKGDRPFSAFLTMGQFRESYNLQKRISVKSSINFGVLGPASMGSLVQSSIHNIEPVGWNNQIKNNIVINYSIKIEKGIISTPHIELNLTVGGNFGTIFNKINSGLYFRTGSFSPVVKCATTSYGSSANNNAIQYWFFVTGETNLVAYDATLQGGLFNNENPYVIQNNDINRVIVNLSIGVALYYKQFGVEFQNFYLSPEFKNAYDFRWGRIKLAFQF